MSPRWTKIWRDMQHSGGRMALIVAALAASMAGVVTMLSAYLVLAREVPLNYLGTQPAAAQLELQHEPSAALLQRLRARPGVRGAELGGTLLGRIQVGQQGWMPLMLFVVSDFEAWQINRVHADSGSWPPPPGSLLIERSAMAMSQARVGGQVQIELPAAGRIGIGVAGTVHDPGVAPAWQEQTVYAYVSQATLAQRGQPLPLDLLKLRLHDDAELPAIEAEVQRLAAWLAEQGEPVLQARIPPPRLHPHQSQMMTVVGMLLIFSLLGLLLGAVLTASTIGGLLAQQRRQIAIMKAIGARSAQIATLYLLMVGLLGLAAVAIGWPLGWAAGRGLMSLVAQLLNLRLDSLALPGWMLPASVGVGIVAPLLATLLPIWLAARRTVRAAIDDHGVSASAAADSGPGGRLMARLLARLSLGDAALTLALRNTFRRRARLFMTLLLLGGAGAMFITSLNLRAAWEARVQEAAADRHFDLELRLEQPQPLARLEPLLRGALPGLRAFESWSISATSLHQGGGLEVVHSYPDGGHGSLALRAAPPATALIAHRLGAGRWLRAGERGSVVLNSGASQASGLRGARPGDWLDLEIAGRPQRLLVVGIIKEPLTPSALYTTPESYAELTGTAGHSNALRIALRDGSDAEQSATALVAALEGAGMGVKFLLTEARFGAAQGGHVYILVYALAFIAGLMAVVGLLGLASALGSAVLERTREIGVLRTIGAGSAAVLRSVLAEGLVIALLSVLLALLLATGLSARVGAVLGAISPQQLLLQLSPLALGLWLLLLLPGALLVSAWPARRAARLTIRETLNSY
ncbi:FtsX-like permease family protein [Paucibacter sediminis]|uniref:FtsX-like permease family protein n=1 Tax=Paucibacter sediminis TaxID=3019553 RepID=A0AA95NJ90_9BURK|nr:FtsX-like permease family protein [Paucibacter sp. S2-9]WIT13353.1 FtsX-like permease family protein [Paucibacter sp. S2-9]